MAGFDPVKSVRRVFLPLCLLAGIVAGCLAAPGFAAGRGEPGPVFTVRVDLADREADLKLLAELDLDIDGVFDGWARVHVVAEERAKLEALGFRLSPLPDPARPVDPLPDGDGPDLRESLVPAVYHTYATLTADLQTIAADHPQITRLISTGPSVQDRQLWIMKITDNPDAEEDEPEVAYISSMHGDEVVGKELCFNLIDYITDNYGVDPRITDLVNEYEIWIMPSMNPDGTELVQRYNANGYDLNRHFPDEFVDPVNTTEGRQPEAAAIMTWSRDRRIILSANFHGGALLVNYPRDGNPAGASVFSPTEAPDQDALLSVSRTYADNNLPMYNSTGFDHGVTNGAEWYAINGGMQDWRYVWHGGFEVTVELDDTKWPPGAELPAFWDDNRESMLAYFERASEGVRGLVTDATTGLPVAATVWFEANSYPSYTDPDVGDYHRIVLPGTYSMEVRATGYDPQVLSVEVLAGSAARYDIQLQPRPTEMQTAGSRVEDGVTGDGWLDPGEAADLVVTLTNLGETATGIQARLEPTGWYAGVTRPESAFPSIGTAESAESYAPHFGVLPDAAVPPGHKLGFAVRWSSEQGSGVTDPFFLDVGAPTCQDVAASDLPQAIADYQTTTSQVVVDPGVADSIQVALDLTHTYIGDLQVKLTSPAATSVLLHNRGGGSADDIVGTYGVDLTSAESLAMFHGEPTGGTWTLTVEDLAGGDTGSVNSWTLHVCGRPAEASVPEMKFADLARGESGVLLEWWPYPGMASYRVYRATDPSSAALFLDVTGEDGDATDTSFLDVSTAPLVYYLVTAVGPQAEEGPKGHFGE